MGEIGDVKLPKLENNQKSYAGIPEAVFVEDVEAFMKESGDEENVEKVLKSLDEQHSKYKFMEFNIISRKRRLRQQIPDLAKSLEMITILKNQTSDQETQFLLSEQVFVKTCVPPTKTVCLWLGANVMLEYPLDAAEELLQKNKQSAEINLKCLEHDQEFLRDQITTTEVNMARVHNYDVKKRQANKAVD
ncbi:prefoldin subunit 3 [Toxorhynchites rutilus septentrionalis]|uniref:prefoldin subunit 3 n=1 Tax=Toxorhynchites rutilus septentrionalis TaxID=329112 RepID=UPI002479A300|nr:prefoldin subunit 3 [Toxorhynchites rutilus septentrionalis]